MPRSFKIPRGYRSPIFTALKNYRNTIDPRKKDKSPTVIDLDTLVIKIARHFGFCYGVENAIEIAYKALEENPDKRIFLLSEMIHNPQVNGNLREKGIDFLFTTYGEEIIPLSQLKPDDIVVIPAFGTTLELFDKLQSLGVDILNYNTTCPFVEKVWKRARSLGEKDFSIIIHGKHKHEETRATFSHASHYGPSIVISGMDEAVYLARFIDGEMSEGEFLNIFKGRYSKNFNPKESLSKFGVVNQTTMLANETREISQFLRDALLKKYGEEQLNLHFADTRDTLCYATSENQEATKQMIASKGDFSIIVGGYNSSNTSHLVELCAESMPSYFVKDADEIISNRVIRHLDVHDWQLKETTEWYSESPKPVLLISAGASCPDSLVYSVIERVLSVQGVSIDKFNDAIKKLCATLDQRDVKLGNSSKLQIL